MKVILTKDVQKVGHKFETKEVKPGFGQNFLIKNGFAVLANKENEKKMKSLIEAHRETLRLKEELLEKSILNLEGATLSFTRKVNDKGSLFDKVDVRDVREALREQLNLELDEKHIHLQTPIKEAGEGTVVVKIGEKEATIKVVVEAEE